MPQFPIEHFDENGRLHRLDGPAYIDDDYQEYRQNGRWHRLDGPARMWANGDMEYYHDNVMPRSMIDFLILEPDQVMDFEMFPSASHCPKILGNTHDDHAYRFGDRDELTLAILKYL